MSVKAATRQFCSRARTWGVWADFSKRSPSLRVSDEALRKDLLQGIDPKAGPHSSPSDYHRLLYKSPVAIDEAFKEAYEILEHDAETKHFDGSSEAAVEAEKYNPEVLHNVENGIFDTALPVYRHYLEQKWKEHDLVLTMQRLEQLHVIPDTMPTLDPKADVKVKFGHNQRLEFSLFVEPGTVLPAFAVNRPPTIKVQEFDTSDHKSGLYTILLVNPDVPDLAENSFTSSLQYGLHNVPLDYVNNVISPNNLIENPQWVFQPYTPLTPEKNSPLQRACLWVFRQQEKNQISSEVSENFDIRAFAEVYKLMAVGAHVWRQGFDRSVNDLRKMFGLPKGLVYERERGDKPLGVALGN